MFSTFVSYLSLSLSLYLLSQLEEHHRRFYQNAWSDSSTCSSTISSPDSSPESSPDRSPIASPVQDVVLSSIPTPASGSFSSPILSPDPCPVASSSGKSGTTSAVSGIQSSGKLGAERAVSDIPSSAKLGAERAVSDIPSSGKLGTESAVSDIPSSGKLGTKSAVSDLPSSGKLGTEIAVSGIPSSRVLGIACSRISGIPSPNASPVTGFVLSPTGSSVAFSSNASSPSQSPDRSPITSPVTGIPTPILSSGSGSRCEEEVNERAHLGHKDSKCYKNELRLHLMSEDERKIHESLKICPWTMEIYMAPERNSSSNSSRWKDDTSERPPPRKRSINDLRSNTYRDRYNREVEKSDGYYVNDRPGRRVHGEIYPVNLSNEENIVKCEKLALTAIRAYNKKNTRDLQLVKLVMATFQSVCGPLYYLTFVAKHPHAMNPAEKCGKTYQAKVFRYDKVVAFRVHPEKSKPDPKERLWLDDDYDSEEEKVVNRKRLSLNSNKDSYRKRKQNTGD